MKKLSRRIITVIFTCMIVLCFSGICMATVQAATPKLNVTKKTIYERGTNYQLKVKNKPKGATYEWSSSNEKVATVNGLGMVTSVKKGSAIITCKITYKDKSVMKLTCNITVKIAATKVEINNALLKNNAQHMEIGQTYDFNRTITPAGSSDKTYWVIDDESIATVDKNGVVTALTEGSVTLQARSGASKAKAMSDLNHVTDAIIINISSVEAQVTDLKLESAKVVKVTFSHAMNSSSLITNYGYLSSNVIVEAKTINGVAAKDPGTINATLSTDGKTLTLTAANNWSGTYNFTIESDVLTQSGISFRGYNEQVDLSDKNQPTYTGTTLDDTGMIASINFSEPIDITNLQKPTLITSVGLSTNYVLTNINNYKLSEDKCSITIDLSTIDLADRNKSLSFNLSGVKDLQGNWSNPYTNVVYVYTDTTTQPNATLVRVERSSKTVVTAIYSKSIQIPGMMSINGTLLTGIVDTANRKKVNFTLTDALANQTVAMTGYVYGWCSYNSTTYGSNTNFTVDMSIASSVPQIVSNSFTSNTVNGSIVNTLKLVFNKDVLLVATSGTFSVTYSDNNGNVIPYNVGYTATVSGKEVTITLDNKNTSGVGLYTILIPAYFVYDAYGNYNLGANTVMSVTKTTTTPLPAPRDIIQTTENRSVFQISFNAKVDEASVVQIANYAIGDVHPIAARIISNSDAGATIEVTFAAGAFPQTMYYPFVVKGITGYGNSYSAMQEYSYYMNVLENAAPVLQSAVLSNGTIITLTFSEDIIGKPSFNVVQNGVIISQNSASNSYIAGNTIVINLATSVAANNLMISPTTDNYITDLNQNLAVIPSQRMVTY